MMQRALMTTRKLRNGRKRRNGPNARTEAVVAFVASVACDAACVDGCDSSCTRCADMKNSRL